MFSVMTESGQVVADDTTFPIIGERKWFSEGEHIEPNCLLVGVYGRDFPEGGTLVPLQGTVNSLKFKTTAMWLMVFRRTPAKTFGDFGMITYDASGAPSFSTGDHHFQVHSESTLPVSARVNYSEGIFNDLIYCVAHNFLVETGWQQTQVPWWGASLYGIRRVGNSLRADAGAFVIRSPIPIHEYTFNDPPYLLSLLRLQGKPS